MNWRGMSSNEEGLARRVRRLAAFECAGLVPFVGEKVIDGRQEKRAEAAPAAVHGFQIILPNEPAEEFLRRVLRIRRRQAFAAHVGIERIPISAAEFFQSRRGSRRIAIARCGDDAPARGVEGHRARKNATAGIA